MQALGLPQIATPEEQLPVDTGFIVFNDWTYPNFIAMLRELGVAWQPSNMSFSLACERTGLEYNGTSVNSLFAQRRNAFSPSFLRMIADILRFNAAAKRWLRDTREDTTLGGFLAAGRYSTQFVEHYIVPMGRAIWSAEASTMLGFPARFFIAFFDRHGFTIRRQDLRRINPARIDLFAPKAAQTHNGGVPLPVERPDFKSGWGRQTVSGGFDSHPPPPRISKERA